MAKDRLEQRTDDMDMLIRRYFDGCNEADVEKMVSCPTSQKTHYVEHCEHEPWPEH